MSLKVLLPYRVFIERPRVTHIQVTTSAGAFGLLPQRLDCTASIVPGILVYRTAEEGETYLAVDEGVLVKTGLQVTVSVRNAIGGEDLGKLRAAVEHEFLNLDEREKSVRTVLARLESDLVRRFLELQHG